jgi:hypothetical protein
MGYNSDGEVGSFFIAVVGELEDFDSEDDDDDEISPPKTLAHQHLMESLIHHCLRKLNCHQVLHLS